MPYPHLSRNSADLSSLQITRKATQSSGRSLFYNVIILVSLLCSVASHAQKITAKEGSFGIDEKNRIIVWHRPDLDSVVRAQEKIKSFDFGENFSPVDAKATLSYSEAFGLEHDNERYELYVTQLPVVHIKIDQEIKDNLKKPGYFTYFNRDKLIKNPVGIEHRGNLSLTFPKKSYDLEFWTDSVQKVSKDITFEGLKTDDDWVLDGLFNEPLRLRSYLATSLWKEIRAPYYLSKAPNARSGADMNYVELFKNGSYQGIYGLSESVARSLLELKKNNAKQVHGELFKASSYDGAPSFLKAPEYNNLFPHWAGFEMEYPIVEYKSHWENVYQLVDLVVRSDDETFLREIGRSVHMATVVDYYLFVNLLRATDNLGKNYYLARYDENSPFFLVPWDLDGVMGIIQDGKRIATTDDILSNGLFDRLKKLDADGFEDKLSARWSALRKSAYSDEALFKNMEQLYVYMKSDKIYERERKIWPDQKTEQEHYDYLKNWLKDRLAYLDVVFKEDKSSEENGSVR